MLRKGRLYDNKLSRLYGHVPFDKEPHREDVSRERDAGPRRINRGKGGKSIITRDTQESVAMLFHCSAATSSDPSVADHVVIYLFPCPSGVIGSPRSPVSLPTRNLLLIMETGLATTQLVDSVAYVEQHTVVSDHGNQ